MIDTPRQLESLLEPIDGLRPFPRNAREGHDIAAISVSLRELGWHAPIVARLDGEVIIGHGRLEAAKSLGEAMVPVLRVDDDEARAIARGLADNRTSELSQWNLGRLEELSLEIGDMPDLLDGLSLGSITPVEPDFQPIDSDDVTDLGSPSITVCPECGYEWEK